MKGTGEWIRSDRLLLSLVLVVTLLASSLFVMPEKVEAAPAPPANLTAVYDSAAGTVNLNWTDTSSNETGFHIETATRADFQFSITFTVGANVTTYNDASVYAGDTFYYRVSSYDDTGDSAFSNTASVEIPLFPPTVPVAPGNLRGTILSANQINITWTDNSVDETGFLLERSTSPAFNQNLVSFNPAANTESQLDTVALNATYYYRLSAYNTLGPSPYSNVMTITIAVPNAPGSLTAAAASESQVNLYWSDNSNNESSFRIERSADPGFGGPITTFPVGANITSYHDSPVSPSTTYYYRVVAVNALGESAASAQASVTTPSEPVIPAAPTDLILTASTPNRVDLSWTDNSNNETGFVIERAADSGFVNGYTRFETGPDAISFSDISVFPNTSYVYRVSAVNSVGPSGFSNILNVTTPPQTPASPSGLNATVISGNQVNLTWIDNSDNEEGFTVQRASSPDFTSGFEEFGIPVVNASSYNDMSTVINTTYYYRVLAYNSSGNSLPSGAIEVATHTSIPDPPSGLTGTLINPNRIDLSWTDNSPNETGFRLYTALDPGFLQGQVTITLPANTTTYSDLSVYRGDTFYYRVTAFNGLGESPASPDFIYTIPAGTPAVLEGPTNLIATAVHGNRVDLRFVDHTEYEVGFLLERAEDDLFTLNPQTFIIPVNNNTGGQVVFSDYSAVPFTTYFYRVRAYNATGSSLESNIVSATTPDAVPAAPDSLTGTVVDNTAINLTWADASAIETGFRVERATNPAFTGLTPFSIAADVTTYTDTNLIPGNTYYYRVFAFNLVGDSDGPSNTLIITAGIPAAPENLSVASVSRARVVLSWIDASDNESGYRIERASSEDFLSGFVSFNAPANSMTFNDISVAPDVTYYYRVVAINDAGDSLPSNVVSVTTAADAPSSPDNLTATVIGAGRVDLTWTDTSANETGFRIERATSSNFAAPVTVFPVVANLESFSDITTSPSSTYYYRIFAVNELGNSPASNTAIVTTPEAVPEETPQPPTSLTAELISANRIDLSWTDNSDNEVGFRIYTALDAGFTLSPVTITVPTNTVSYVDLSVYPGDTFYYQVAAFNFHGESTVSNTVSVDISASAVNPPLSPSSLSATVISPYQVSLSWADNSDNEVSFLLERALDELFTMAPTTFVIPENSTSFIDETALPAQTYHYRLMAYNALDISPPSNVATAFTPEVGPAAPSELTAIVIGPSQVNLSWIDNSNNETEFVIQRDNTGAFANPDILLSGANTTTFMDDTVAPSTTYFYRILAYNPVSSSVPSNVVSVVTPSAAAPNSPSTLSAVVVNANRVDLSWTDNSSNETGFRVERATNNDFTQNLVPFDIPSPGVTSLIDNSTSINTVYFYRVLAYNSNGDSAPSNTVSVNTGVPVPPGNLRGTLFSASRIDLAWNDNSNNETGFRIDRATTPDFSANLVSFPAGINALNYSDVTVTRGITYYYRVAAVNNNGSSAFSNTFSVLVEVPAAASGLSASLFSPTAVDLTWTDNSDNESGFQVDRATNPAFTANFSSFFAPANSTSYRNSGLLPNVTYYYRIIAYNTVGDAAESNIVSIAVSVPAQPTNLNASAFGPTRIDLTWTDNATNESSYRIQRADDESFNTGVTSFTAAANAASYSDDSAAPNSTYYYRVYAVNGAGDSLASNTASTTTPSGAANVNISTVLQGNSRPESGWVIPLTVKFFVPGANVLTDVPVYTFNLTTSRSGNTAVVQCTGVALGNYDIAAISEHTLLNVKRNVTVAIPGNDVFLGTLIEGNANNDATINALDISILSEAYTTYNAMADFDRNGLINALDVALLSANYFTASPVEVP